MGSIFSILSKQAKSGDVPATTSVTLRMRSPPLIASPSPFPDRMLLPWDILRAIMSVLGRKDAAAMSRTCHALRREAPRMLLGGLVVIRDEAHLLSLSNFLFADCIRFDFLRQLHLDFTPSQDESTSPLDSILWGAVKLELLWMSRPVMRALYRARPRALQLMPGLRAICLSGKPQEIADVLSSMKAPLLVEASIKYLVRDVYGDLWGHEDISDDEDTEDPAHEEDTEYIVDEEDAEDRADEKYTAVIVDEESMANIADGAYVEDIADEDMEDMEDTEDMDDVDDVEDVEGLESPLINVLRPFSLELQALRISGDSLHPYTDLAACLTFPSVTTLFLDFRLYLDLSTLAYCFPNLQDLTIYSKFPPVSLPSDDDTSFERDPTHSWESLALLKGGVTTLYALGNTCEVDLLYLDKSDLLDHHFAEYERLESLLESCAPKSLSLSLLMGDVDIGCLEIALEPFADTLQSLRLSLHWNPDYGELFEDPVLYLCSLCEIISPLAIDRLHIVLEMVTPRDADRHSYVVPAGAAPELADFDLDKLAKCVFDSSDTLEIFCFEPGSTPWEKPQIFERSDEANEDGVWAYWLVPWDDPDAVVIMEESPFQLPREDFMTVEA